MQDDSGLSGLFGFSGFFGFAQQEKSNKSKTLDKSPGLAALRFAIRKTYSNLTAFLTIFLFDSSHTPQGNASAACTTTHFINDL